MMRKARFCLLIAISATASYLFLLRPPGSGSPNGPSPPASRSESLAVSPAILPAAPVAPPASPPPLPGARAEEPAPQRPPPESGAPEGEEDGERPAGSPAEPEERYPRETKRSSAERVRSEIERIRKSDDLIAESQREIRGEIRRGFETVLRSAANDQVDIARFFGEAVILVPRAGLDPEKPYFYELVLEPRLAVRTVRASPPADRFRQYRDLLAYPYDQLPRPLRELRRRAFVRADIFLYAALIPASEWALVIARRKRALASFNRGRSSDARTVEDVRRFTMRYVKLEEGTIDIEVVEILFTDGTRWSPPDRS